MSTEITERDEPNLAEIKKRKRIQKSQIKSKIKTASSKRYVVAIKVFVTPEEKQQLELKAQKENFKSLSNLIRYHLGLNLNESGRRKRISKDFFNNIDDAEIDRLLSNSLG